MKNNRNMKRRGFTLVELLIVIVVIGVLSAMMMLSSTEAVSSARASNIVSNLRNLKTAALAYYIDHIDAYENVETISKDLNTVRSGILGYMGNDVSNIDTKYNFTGTDTGTWYVYYTLAGSDGNVKTKLAGRAASTNLRGASNAASFTSADASGVYSNQAVVGMFIR